MNSYLQKRQQILQEMERIQQMERGSVQAESRPSKRDCHRDCGPYYKHQIWENGQNQTRRVSKEKAEQLTEAIQARQRFENLAQQFIDTTVAMTRAQASGEFKKNNLRSKPPSRKKPRTTSNAS